MDIWAVVPVKAFHLAKQRLASTYSQEFRHQLARTMLCDVLDTLVRADGIGGILLVTLDPEVKLLAPEYHAEVLDEAPGGGLNQAVAAAALRLASQARSGMLVVAGDLPGITRSEIESLLSFHDSKSRAVTVVPAHDRKGTNALLMTPPDAMKPAFGENSFERHLQGARDAGLKAVELTLNSFGLDLDNPADVKLFARDESSTRTGRYLQDQGLVHCNS